MNCVLLFILLSISALAVAQQRAAGGMSKTFYDAFGYPYKVADVVDLNIPFPDLPDNMLNK